MRRILCACAFALALLSACTIAGYRADCYEVVVGCLDVDLADGTWSFGGMCIEKLHSACPDLKDFKFEAGVDANGNGRLDPEEKVIDINDDSPGSLACAGAATGHLDPEDRGKKILYHYECYKQGQAKPLVSKSGKKEVK